VHQDSLSYKLQTLPDKAKFGLKWKTTLPSTNVLMVCFSSNQDMAFILSEAQLSTYSPPRLQLRTFNWLRLGGFVAVRLSLADGTTTATTSLSPTHWARKAWPQAFPHDLMKAWIENAAPALLGSASLLAFNRSNSKLLLASTLTNSLQLFDSDLTTLATPPRLSGALSFPLPLLFFSLPKGLDLAQLNFEISSIVWVTETVFFVVEGPTIKAFRQTDADLVCFHSFQFIANDQKVQSLHCLVNTDTLALIHSQDSATPQLTIATFTQHNFAASFNDLWQV